MSSDRDQPTIIDFVAVVGNSALVMLMVGSLTWFLVDTLYQGQYSARLIYSLSLFVFAAVLIARIAIQLGTGRASLYGLGLGGAVFLAMLRFVEYPNRSLAAFGPFINLGLMALIWWVANKLTWDCTHLEEDRRVSGRGLLAATGLNETPEPEPDDTIQAARRKKKDPRGFFGWLARFERYRDARRNRPHTPGTWVLYFGLAALPVFALGQSLIPASESARRWSTLLEMMVFVGSGLGLLVTTSLLTLREYLRERGANLSSPISLGWLGLGAGLIVFFLVLAMLLPRPHTELPWFDLSGESQSDRTASRYAQVNDGSTGEGPGSNGSQTEHDPQASPSQPGKNGSDSSTKASNPGGKPGDQGAKSNSSPNGPPSTSSQQGTPSTAKRQGSSTPATNRGTQSTAQRGNEPQTQSSQSQSKSEQEESGSESEGSTASESLSRMRELLDAVGSFVKWIVWAVVLLAVLVGLVVIVLKWLAPFTDWARGLLDWLRNLFSNRSRQRAVAQSDLEDVPRAPRAPPFHSFSNPFTDGTARRRSPRALTAYTFAAFEAWGADHDQPRDPAETPGEYAARIGGEQPGMDSGAKQVAHLTVRAMYSPTSLPGDTLQILAAFWGQMDEHYNRRDT